MVRKWRWMMARRSPPVCSSGPRAPRHHRCCRLCPAPSSGAAWSRTIVFRYRIWPGVWALGDCALVPDALNPGKFYPPTAQHAMRQAAVLANNIERQCAGRSLKPFEFKIIGLRQPLAKEGSDRARLDAGSDFLEGPRSITNSAITEHLLVDANWDSVSIPITLIFSVASL